MSAFHEAYKQLNTAQKEAVDSIDGPLLVIAGPGTGKTQLLSARVANILQETDTPAGNILCLTFTESGAENMRRRLAQFIGQGAYDVTISTYHAFGSDLISSYPEYFLGTRLQNSVDDLGKRQIVLDIVDAMSFRNPLKQTRHHPGDLLTTISETKRAMLDSGDLHSIARQNREFISVASKQLQPIFANFTIMPRALPKVMPYFEQTLAALHTLVPGNEFVKHFEPLARLCVEELVNAIERANADAKTTPLTNWKNKWLAKNSDNQFVISGELENRRIEALADVLDDYQAALAKRGLYDFDDMILRSIRALESNNDLRFTLQERYQYILLDEFQDTNAAQLRLIQLLTDNPVNEGRPNILAVGDDDQAIYAFQGAQYSNMIEYYRMFRDTKVINLTENYRSSPDILTTAAAVAEQIDSRLQEQFDGVSKTLAAAVVKMGSVERRDFQSDIAERAWIASTIKDLIDGGTPASEIAVLAPKHKHIEPLVAYLNAHGVPVRYEKRENILDAPVVRQLITMSQLLLALARGDQGSAASLWPQVLSYDFWQIPIDIIWRLSWEVNEKQTWNAAVLDSNNAQVHRAAEVLLAAAARVGTENCETILDYLMGSAALETHSDPDRTVNVSSPLKDYYTSKQMRSQSPELFYETLSHLTVLRAKLREFQDQADAALMLEDFVRFVGMYEAAEQPMINTSPYAQASEAVQLLTVFKAKGLEYDHVFLPNCLDDVWGSTSRGNSNKLTLPPNLAPIRHAGVTDDERLRILFVALTRAKHHLHLTAATKSFSGKATKRLKYFDEREQPNGDFKAMILPPAAQSLVTDDSNAPTAELLEQDWRTRHIEGLVDTDLKSLLARQIDRYQLSPTHLVSFLDVLYGGPERFFFDVILRFPSRPNPETQFGTAIHETLEWYQHQVSEQGSAPSLEETIEHFSVRIKAKKLTAQRSSQEIERGGLTLASYLHKRAKIFRPEDIAEKNFRSESVFVGETHMAGKVDRMEIDKTKQTIVVVDYKTGKSSNKWLNSDARLHKHQLQLYSYKLLIEGSRSFRGYSVPTGRLEFIEPDGEGRINNLELSFNTDEGARVRKLISAVWKHVKELNFPDTGGYPATLAGMKQFEQDLIDGTI